jgi:hypothetical protein
MYKWSLCDLVLILLQTYQNHTLSWIFIYQGSSFTFERFNIPGI